MRKPWIILMLAASLPGLLTCQSVAHAPRPAARLDVAVNEASGLAASIRHPGQYYTHNDSTWLWPQPELYVLDAQGQRLGQLSLPGAQADDWEALAAFTWQGQAYLLVGDVGDNRASRAEGVLLHLLAEPTTLTATVVPLWSLRVTYPGGPRDVEALAVDAEAGWIYLLSKRIQPPQLYRVPLRGGSVQAELLGAIAPLDAPFVSELPSQVYVLPFLHQPTDMAFAPDHREISVLTYGHLYVFSRQPDQTWLQALQGTPQVIDLPGARQYEGLSYTPDGQAWRIVEEGEATVFLHIPRTALMANPAP